MPNKELIEAVGKYIEKNYIPDRDDIVMDNEMKSIFDHISSYRERRVENRKYEYDENEEIIEEDVNFEEEEVIEEVIYVDEDGNPVEYLLDDDEIEKVEEVEGLEEEDFEIDDDEIGEYDDEEYDESDIPKAKFTSQTSLTMPQNRKIEDLMGQLEETFSQRLLRMISERQHSK